MSSESFWQATAPAREFAPLDRTLRVDVLVVGGGICGVTAAYLLSKTGRAVALVERDRIGGGETAHTTAHVTCVTDERLTDLVKTFGRDHARAAWDAGAQAMRQIQTNAEEAGIECELRQVPGFLYAAADADTEQEIERLREEAQLASELGFDAAYLSAVPVAKRPGIRFSNQLKFHPLKYLAGLAREAAAQGAQLFEDTSVASFEEAPRRAIANGYAIECDHVILATHVPLQGLANLVSASLLQTKLAAYSTYALGLKLPPGTLPEALFWDTADPYSYLRTDRRADGDYAILGGEDHKTGQEPDTEACYARLEERALALVPGAVTDRRWSGQVIETVDGLPYIGEIAKQQFVATGFAGNGMTFGTIGGIMARDAVMGVTNPWGDLFSVERKKLSAGWDYLTENKDYPYLLVKDHLAGVDAESVAAIPMGEGRIVRKDREKIAVYRDEGGKVAACSAVCPHLGCIVAWNPAEKTWDCPCHGSRFTGKGELIAGPAERGLKTASIS